MKKLAVTLVVGVILLAMLLSLIELWHSGSVRTRALAVKPGDSKMQVEKALGRPVHIFTPDPQARTNFLAALLSVRSETWAYGSRFDLRLAFHGQSPIRFRIFLPEADDVSVVFDRSGRVAEVMIPKSSP